MFLISENSKWGCQSLYDAFEADGDFEPTVAASVLRSVHKGWDSTRRISGENFEFFKKRGARTVLAYKDGKYADLREFSPDIVFYSELFDLTAEHAPYKVSKFALTCYLTYGISAFNYPFLYTPLHRLLWRFFFNESENKVVAGLDERARESCVSLGYPKLDVYFDGRVPDPSAYWRDPGKIKVVYAPHHSFETNEHSIRIATFRENGRFILDLAKRRPGTTWIFKPHPRLRYALGVNGVMTEDEIEAYWDEWSKVGAVYEEGDYFDIFRTSNLMITDCCSFLTEYLPTLKPVINPQNPEALKMTEFGEKVVQGYYQTCGNRQLEAVFDMLAGGSDPKFEIRRTVAGGLDMFWGKSADRILQYIKLQLGMGRL